MKQERSPRKKTTWYRDKTFGTDLILGVNTPREDDAMLVSDFVNERHLDGVDFEPNDNGTNEIQIAAAESTARQRNSTEVVFLEFGEPRRQSANRDRLRSQTLSVALVSRPTEYHVGEEYIARMV